MTAVEGFATLYDGSAKPPQTYSCEYISNYMFQDVAGTRHLLNISLAQIGAGQTHCDLIGSPPQNYLSGGDDFYSATTTAPGPAPFLPNPVTVAGNDGTVDNFSTCGTIFNCSKSAFGSYPTDITAANGDTS